MGHRYDPYANCRLVTAMKQTGGAALRSDGVLNLQELRSSEQNCLILPAENLFSGDVQHLQICAICSTGLAAGGGSGMH